MSIVSDAFLGVVITLLSTALLWVLAWLANQARARSRWGFIHANHVTTVLSASTEVDTGEYLRPTTGIGQAKALAVLAPSLRRGWKSIDLQNVVFPEEIQGRELEGDIILIGGPKTNEVTKRALEKCGGDFGVSQDGSVITAHNETYSGTVHETNRDYGLIIRAENPFAAGRKMVLLSGCHTYGTIGAARFFVESKLPRGNFAMVVETQVQGKHALPPRMRWCSD